MKTITASRLEKLLAAAERAHARYEKRTGRQDGNWPKWYARFIVERIETKMNKK